MLNCIQLETGGRNRLQSVFEMRNEICPISYIRYSAGHNYTKL